MGAASVAANGKIVFQAACGWADVEWGVKNAADTRFLIYSVTKQFTAAAVLLLLEEKRFRLTDPIGKYVPGLPDSWQSATIHQLLTHTSGVPIYTVSADQKGYNPELKGVDAESIPNSLLLPVRGRPLLFPHGTKFTYNNTGYILLGMLIEKASGARYEEFLQRRIFQRLAMRDSGYADPRTIVPRKARVYVLRRERKCGTRISLIRGSLGRPEPSTPPYRI